MIIETYREHRAWTRHPRPPVARELRFDGVAFVITDRDDSGYEITRRRADETDIPLPLAVDAMARFGLDYAASAVHLPLEVFPI